MVGGDPDRVPVQQVRAVIIEAQSDGELHEHIRREIEASDRRGLADTKVRLGRRLGWYALRGAAAGSRSGDRHRQGPWLGRAGCGSAAQRPAAR